MGGSGRSSDKATRAIPLQRQERHGDSGYGGKSGCLVLNHLGAGPENLMDALFRKGGIYSHVKERKKAVSLIRQTRAEHLEAAGSISPPQTSGRMVMSCKSDNYGKCGDQGARCRGQGTRRWSRTAPHRATEVRTVGTRVADHARQQEAVLPTEMPIASPPRAISL